jgi:Ca2+/Na+ antiporter
MEFDSGIDENTNAPTHQSFYIDLAFAIVYALVLAVLVVTSYKTLGNKNNRNAFIILTIFFIFLTLVGKLLVICIYSVI